MPKHGSIRKVYACLAVTCHLHFWQNDRDFLRATAVTRGWNGYRNKSQHRKSTLRKFSRRSSRDTNPRPFNHQFGALTTELSPPPVPNNLSFLALYLSLCYLPCQSLHTHRSSERLRQRPQQLVVPGFMSLPLLPPLSVTSHPQVVRAAPTTSPTTGRSWLYGSPFVTSPVSHFTPTGRQSGSDNVPNNWSFLALWLSLCYLPCQSLHTHRSSERLRQRPQQLVVPGFMSAPLSPRTVGVALWRKWAGVIDPRTVPHPRLHPRRV